MSDDINAERLPLLETEEDQNPINYKEQCYQTNDQQTEFIKYAEIVVPYWTYGNFNVIEFKHNPNGTIFPVSTVTSKIDAYLTNEVEILFTVANVADLGLEFCEYRISWTWMFNGYIWRRCEKNNESIFKQVAFFKGHPAWGLTFLSVDENINYGYSTRSAFFWDLYVRDVFIDSTAPFPPIIPSLYTAYFDYLERIRQRRSNKREF
ncbi:80_t:CDS:2 [Gigaspora margarita]|uniref:80_t:CDS:1 n=1 Tax=Gigaspora margarita TaxID=4874 RepID=A0ABN7UB45_GIGMA|nr:80_t:CDS:2 [Gigaspora margarita]